MSQVTVTNLRVGTTPAEVITASRAVQNVTTVTASGAGSFGGLITASAGIHIPGGAASTGNIYRTPTQGLTVWAYGGSIYEFLWLRTDGNIVIACVAGTSNVQLGGHINTNTGWGYFLNPAYEWGFYYSVGSGIVVRVANNDGISPIFTGTGDLSLKGHLYISALRGIYLDGGGDTYISEAAPDLMYFVVGGASRMSVGSQVTISAVSSAYGLVVVAPTAAGASYGMLVVAGTSGSDRPLSVSNADQTLSLFFVAGNGVIGMPALPTSNPGPGLLWYDTADGRRVKMGS